MNTFLHCGPTNTNKPACTNEKYCVMERKEKVKLHICAVRISKPPPYAYPYLSVLDGYFHKQKSRNTSTSCLL